MFGKSLKMAAVVLAAMAVLACKGGGEEAATSATTTGPIGVAECDEYVTKYEKCVTSKAPAASRVELKSNVEAMQSSWKAAAANPAAARSLAQGCKQALVTAKTAMASYGCEW
jgi:hypothetical protein